MSKVNAMQKGSLRVKQTKHRPIPSSSLASWPSLLIVDRILIGYLKTVLAASTGGLIFGMAAFFLVREQIHTSCTLKIHALLSTATIVILSSLTLFCFAVVAGGLICIHCAKRERRQSEGSGQNAKQE